MTASSLPLEGTARPTEGPAGSPDRAARLRTGAACVASGAAIAASVPPWGWWPLAFVGLAGWDRLVADQVPRARFARTWLVAAAWLFPALLWMWDLTAPGYVIACGAYAGYFATTVALAPAGRARWFAFPAAVVLAELARWSFPFGGVPLATLPMSQADSPLATSVRLAGPLGLVALVVVGGMALSEATRRRWRPAVLAAGIVVAAAVAGTLAPHGHTVGTLDVALVQGGGPQRTRAVDTDEAVVFERHLEASALVETPVDLVLWPENVVNVEGSIEEHPWFADLQELARDLDAWLSVGIVEGVSETGFRNAQILFSPDGELVDRYDKVRIVPFGEYVPLRGLLETVASGAGLPARDAIAGSGPGILRSEVGDLGVLISWEVFFANRGRAAAQAGSQLQTNPTNGSSYWLTQVQTQQVASSRLRALESGRWVTQAAPTGFTALVTPDGEVVARTAISEQAVVQGTVELREGQTWATLVGPWPLLILALVAYPGGWWLVRRGGTADRKDEP